MIPRITVAATRVGNQGAALEESCKDPLPASTTTLLQFPLVFDQADAFISFETNSVPVSGCERPRAGILGINSRWVILSFLGGPPSRNRLTNSP